MDDEVDDLRTKVLEQGLALGGLQRAAADAEVRQTSNHAQFLEMMAQIFYQTQSVTDFLPDPICGIISRSWAWFDV